jgi:hypothetical protein
MPEKSGMAAVSCARLSPGPPLDAAVCALAGITAKNEKPIDVKAISVVDVMTQPPVNFAKGHHDRVVRQEGSRIATSVHLFLQSIRSEQQRAVPPLSEPPSVPHLRRGRSHRSRSRSKSVR